MLTGTSIAEIPDVFIDPGACPGEGCTYCEIYSASEDLDLFETPSLDANVIGRIKSGETLLSKTGEVHTLPTRFEIYRDSGPFQAGDDVYVLTYGGEGYFRIYHNGELTVTDLGFSPWGGGSGKTCDKPEFCFGRLAKELEFTWWIFVLSEGGSQGWVPHDSSMRWIEPNPRH